MGPFGRSNATIAHTASEELLVERIRTKEGHHVFIYPFEGRAVHEGISALLAYRISLLAPISFSIAMNDYGFELLSEQEIPIQDAFDSDLLSSAHLRHDIERSLNETEMARRRFRDIAQVAGLVFKGYPGKAKAVRHLQSSAQLFFGVFQDMDPNNLLLRQAHEEVMTFQLEESRLRNALERIATQRIASRPPRHAVVFRSGGSTARIAHFGKIGGPNSTHESAIGMKRALIQIRGEKLQLLAEKAIYWPAQKTLIIADLHLGKAMHFRRAGIAVPGAVEQLNLQRLEDLIVRTRPSEVLLLGDLFHSDLNSSWQGFIDLRAKHASAKFTLVSGNHDVLEPTHYSEADIELLPTLDRGQFHFTHHPTEHSLLYNLAGHVHPGIRLIGKAKQTIQLPCFFFGRTAGILPAFGGFTGLCRMKRKETDRVFVTMQGRILRV